MTEGQVAPAAPGGTVGTAGTAPGSAEPSGSGRGWAYRRAWLVLPAASDQLTAEALGLDPSRQVDWAAGLEAVSGDRTSSLVLVTPPVLGVRYAVGTLGVFEDVTEALLTGDGSPLADLAATLHGDVQFFVAHPGAEVYGWAQDRPGGPCRFVVWSADDGVGAAGAPTAIEEALGVDLITGDTDDDRDLAEDLVDETTVFAVAAAWGVDPSGFEDDRADHGPALLGRRAH